MVLELLEKVALYLLLLALSISTALSYLIYYKYRKSSAGYVMFYIFASSLLLVFFFSTDSSMRSFVDLGENIIFVHFFVGIFAGFLWLFLSYSFYKLANSLEHIQGHAPAVYVLAALFISLIMAFSPYVLPISFKMSLLLIQTVVVSVFSVSAIFLIAGLLMNHKKGINIPLFTAYIFYFPLAFAVAELFEFIGQITGIGYFGFLHKFVTLMGTAVLLAFLFVYHRRLLTEQEFVHPSENVQPENKDDRK